VKKAVKRGLTQRLRERVGMGDSDSSDEEEKESKQNSRKKKKVKDIEEGIEEEFEGDTLSNDVHVNGNEHLNHISEKDFVSPSRGRGGAVVGRATKEGSRDRDKDGMPKSRRTSFQLPKAAAGMTSMSMLEQSMPADAVLGKAGAEEVRVAFEAFTISK
jgi:metal transporter CNNM